MTSKKQKSSYGIINRKEVNVVDNPRKGSPLVCQLKMGDKVKIISKPNKYYYGVGISNSVVGFVSRDYVETE